MASQDSPRQPGNGDAAPANQPATADGEATAPGAAPACLELLQGTIRTSFGARRFSVIQPGRFIMGASEDDPEHGTDEDPRHEVSLTLPYLLQTTPVTQAQWEEVMGYNPSSFRNPESPVDNVSWVEAVAYCNALSRRFNLEEAYKLSATTGEPGTPGYGARVQWKGPRSEGFRLPTEAEWEYACRAGGQEVRYGAPDDIAWHHGNCLAGACPVGRKRPNDWGLYDMLGNAAEWCWDLMGEYPPRRVSNPVGPKRGVDRVFRGGTRASHLSELRAAHRDSAEEGHRLSYLGFRVARTILLAAEALEIATPSLPAASSAAVPAQASPSSPSLPLPAGPLAAASPPPAPSVSPLAPSSAAPAPVPSALPSVPLVTIPAGQVWLGSPDDEPDRWRTEGPLHDHRQEHPFALSATPVTQAQWEALMNGNPSRFRGGTRPVEQVSWLDAIFFCNALSRAHGLEEAYRVSALVGSPGQPGFTAEVVWKGLHHPGFRLPTEAEWEYACRAGSLEARYGHLDQVAWFDENSGRQSHPVAQRSPNAWGLYDMLGNVCEWCGDWFGPYSAGQGLPPEGPPRGTQRVYRGGSWYNTAGGCRAAYRNSASPTFRQAWLGFRVARTLLIPQSSHSRDQGSTLGQGPLRHPAVNTAPGSSGAPRSLAEAARAVAWLEALAEGLELQTVLPAWPDTPSSASPDSLEERLTTLLPGLSPEHCQDAEAELNDFCQVAGLDPAEVRPRLSVAAPIRSALVTLEAVANDAHGSDLTLCHLFRQAQARLEALDLCLKLHAPPPDVTALIRSLAARVVDWQAGPRLWDGTRALLAGHVAAFGELEHAPAPLSKARRLLKLAEANLQADEAYTAGVQDAVRRLASLAPFPGLEPLTSLAGSELGEALCRVLTGPPRPLEVEGEAALERLLGMRQAPSWLLDPDFLGPMDELERGLSQALQTVQAKTPGLEPGPLQDTLETLFETAGLLESCDMLLAEAEAHCQQHLELALLRPLADLPPQARVALSQEARQALEARDWTLLDSLLEAAALVADPRDPGPGAGKGPRLKRKNRSNV